MPYNFVTAMKACGLENAKATTITLELFDHKFEACIDITMDDLKENFKSLATILKTDGGVKIAPGPKRKVESFTLWVKHQYCMGRDPAALKYPYAESIINND